MSKFQLSSAKIYVSWTTAPKKRDLKILFRTVIGYMLHEWGKEVWWYFYFIKMCPEPLCFDPKNCEQRLEFLANLYWEQAQRNQCGLIFLFSVSLGSVPELPAESCAEIRASERESAVSGNYWVDSNKTGNVVLVPCDMSKLGKQSHFTSI